MRRVIVVGLFSLVAVATVFGQHRGGSGAPSGTGFPNILFPGGGGPPQPLHPNFNESFAGRLGATIAGRPIAEFPRVAHPEHRRTVVVPYPVVIGGYGYDSSYYSQPAPAPYYQPYPMQQPAPTVIINQNFRADTARPMMRDYSQEPAPGAASEPTMKTYEGNSQSRNYPAQDEKPTIYLVAFKDGSIYPTLAYWVEGDTLHYITMQHSPNRASLDLIDRDLSQRLNDERRVEFKLPNK